MSVRTPVCACGRPAIGLCRDCERPVCGWHSYDQDNVLVCEDDRARRDAQNDAEALASKGTVLNTVRERLPELAEREPIRAEVYERVARRMIFKKGTDVEIRVLEGVCVLNGDAWSDHIDVLASDGHVLAHRANMTVDVPLEEWLDNNGPDGVRRLQDLLKTLR